MGLIYLLILSFFLVVRVFHDTWSFPDICTQMVGISAREVSGIEKYLTTGALIRFRLASIFILYFFISVSMLTPSPSSPLIILPAFLLVTQFGIPNGVYKKVSALDLHD